MVASSNALFSSPPLIYERADHDYPLSSSPASIDLLTPPPQTPAFEVQSTASSSSRTFYPDPTSTAPRILDFDHAAEHTMSSASTPPIKRKHHQSTLGSAFAAVSSNANISPTIQTEKVASDEKRRRISTGWDELCRATVRARQAEERRRASITGEASSGRARVTRNELESSSLKAGHTVNVRAEGSSLRSSFSPFKLDLRDEDDKLALAKGGAGTMGEGEDVDMEAEDELEIRPLSEDEAEIEEEDESSFATSRRRQPIIRSGFSDTRIGHRKMIGNLKTGKRYQREHCE